MSGKKNTRIYNYLFWLFVGLILVLFINKNYFAKNLFINDSLLIDSQQQRQKERVEKNIIDLSGEEKVEPETAGAEPEQAEVEPETAGVEPEQADVIFLLPATEEPEKRVGEAVIPAIMERKIIHKAPFTSQAPFGEWTDPRFQDGCEEAAALMAVRWVGGGDLSKEEAKNEIIKITEYQNEKYGGFIDTSTEDTAERIFRGYFGYQKITVKKNINLEDIISELYNGNLVIAPVNGQKINNPFYTAPGPERHNILIIGYNPATNEFITNDPGTRRGERYAYNQDVLFASIRDYPTGDQSPILSQEKNIIIVYPK